MFLNPVLH